MRINVITVVFAVCTVITGCAEKSPATPRAEEVAGKSKTDQFIKHGWDFNLGRSRDRIIQLMGNPVTMKVEKAKKTAASAPPSSEAIADEVSELNYDGLQIVLYRAAIENVELLQRLSITDGKYKVKWGLNIGSARSEVRTVLGKPDEEQRDQDIYKTRYGAESYVHFTFAEDRVTRIDWLYYIE